MFLRSFRSFLEVVPASRTPDAAELPLMPAMCGPVVHPNPMQTPQTPASQPTTQNTSIVRVARYSGAILKGGVLCGDSLHVPHCPENTNRCLYHLSFSPGRQYIRETQGRNRLRAGGHLMALSGVRRCFTPLLCTTLSFVTKR